MSFIRLLALSYLAWAAVFVLAVILVAHLPFPAGMATRSTTPDHKTVRIATRLPPPETHVARLELAPVTSIPNPPATDDVSPPTPPAAPEPQQMPSQAKQSPPAAVAFKPPSAQLPTATPKPRPVARLELASPPVPVARPHADASPAKPHVVNEPKRSPSGQPRGVATLPSSPTAPSRAGASSHLASAKPDFRIPDPPASSLSNLPAPMQKRAAAEPPVHIPDPPPLEAGRL